MIGNNSPNLGTIKKDRMNSYVPKDSFEKGYDSYMEQGSRDYNTGEPFKDEALRLTGGKYKKENENLPNSVDFMRQYGHTDMNRILKYSNGKPNYSRTF
jgi:hypothetical protein